MDSPLLRLPGAVPAQPAAAGAIVTVADHYERPYEEQHALAEDAGLVDRGDRDVVRVAGPDRLSWLNDLTTQLLTSLPAGQATEALLLSPQGRIEHHVTLVDDGGATWMHAEPGSGAALVEFLDSMRFMLRVEPELLSERFAVLTLGGPNATIPDGVLAAPRGDHTDLFVPREELAELAESLMSAGARPAGMWAYEALRIAAHRPRLGADTDDRTIPHEIGWIETAVHLDKGCYRGQETVARVHNLGRPPRRLVMLHLDGSVDRLPERGAAVESDGRKVGAMGSSARHYELGPIGLALVKRNTPIEATLLVDGVAAAQEIIVSPEAGANVKLDLRRTPR